MSLIISELKNWAKNFITKVVVIYQFIYDL